MHPLDILFLTCLILGGGYTLFTLLMGGFSHALGHAAHLGEALHVPHLTDLVGHHAGPAAAGNGGAGAAGHVNGGSHAGHHGHHHGDSHHHAEADVDGGRFNLFQYFNPLSIAGFLLGFGGIGFVSGLLAPNLAPTLRLMLGGVGGWSLWLIAYLIVTRLFGNAEGSSHNKREELIGVRAQVTAPISGSMPGMVSYVVAGTRQSLRAITEDEDPIPVGAAVRIRRIDNHTAYVMRIDAPAIQTVERRTLE